MKQALDEDAVNDIYREERVYSKWVREQKNRILAIHNVERKREEWKKYFGLHEEPDDSYLSGNVF